MVKVTGCGWFRISLSMLAGLVVTIAAGSCSSPTPESGTNTNWVACNVDADCAKVGARAVCAGGRCQIPSVDGGSCPVIPCPAPGFDPVTCRCRPPLDAGLDASSCNATTGIATHATFGTSVLAVDGSTVYVETSPPAGSGYEIARLTLPCGAPESLVVRQGQVVGRSIVVANGTLVWAAADGVQSMPAGGGSVTPLLSRAMTDPVAVASAGGDVYVGEPNGDVTKVPLAGGAPTSLASGHGQVGAVAVGNGFVYFTALAPFIEGDAGRVQIGSIYRVPAGGGSAEELVSGQNSPNSLVSTPAALYWTNSGPWGVDAPSGPGAVMHLPTSATVPVVDAVETGPEYLNLVSGDLIWVSMGFVPNAIRRLAPGAAAPVDLVSEDKLRGAEFIDAFTAVPGRAYWSESGPDGGRIRSVAIP